MAINTGYFRIGVVVNFIIPGYHILPGIESSSQIRTHIFNVNRNFCNVNNNPVNVHSKGREICYPCT